MNVWNFIWIDSFECALLENSRNLIMALNNEVIRSPVVHQHLDQVYISSDFSFVTTFYA